METASPLIPRYPNYYHWMVETVPKVRYLRAYEAATGEAVTVLIPADPPPFVTETLRLLDWPSDRIQHATAPAYRVENLIVPSYPERTRSDFDWLREEILAAVDAADSSSAVDDADGRNVYVSRSNAVERRVLNEDEVMDVLSEYGFSRYHLEDRSVAENARLFDRADVVVGPHGAGLTDIIFAGDCTLLELFGAKVKKPYRLLADAVGVDYEAMHCEPASADIVVDLERLAARVSELVTRH